MELKFKGSHIFYDAYCTLSEGETTEGVVDMPEAHKEMLIASFPEDFEKVEGSKVAKNLVVETPEDSLVVENGEAKLAKLTRKK